MLNNLFLDRYICLFFNSNPHSALPLPTPLYFFSSSSFHVSKGLDMIFSKILLSEALSKPLCLLIYSSLATSFLEVKIYDRKKRNSENIYEEKRAYICERKSWYRKREESFVLSRTVLLSMDPILHKADQERFVQDEKRLDSDQ